MSNYTKTTDFEAKDSLPTGDSGKIIRGSEFETEFDAISTAIGTKADTAGPTFTGTLTFETISDGTIGVTAFVDEDDMSSNSATLVPTQQSVKAYVDSQVTAQDLDFQADSGGALSIDLDSETLTFTGGTGIDTSGSGNTVTFAIDSTVATLTGSQTLTNKTLTSPVLNTGVSGTAVLDEDNMASNSATQLATQQSIKAYVDSQVGANNELSEILANGNTTGGTNIVFGDSASVSDDRLVFGAGSDLQIYHSGVHSYIDDAGTGNLTLRGNASVRVEKYEGEILADFAADGAVSLYHDNSVKIATTSTGVSVTGNVAVSGTVDGRDVATDGSKLDGIEASADVTDTANVTAAGALMDSELTSEASVKALNQGVATTDSPTFAGVTANGTVEFDGLSGTGSVNVTDILDQDDMSSNSATALATQQSIKAYVDSQVATVDTLAEVLGNGNTTGGTDLSVSSGDDITFADSSKAIFGAGSDLQIYHDGAQSIIADSGTGNFFLRGENVYVQNAAGTATYLAGVGNEAALYYVGDKKLATTSTGIDVTGVITTDGMTTSADINFGDNDKAVFGAGNDFEIYSDGTNGVLKNTNSNYILLDSDNLAIRSQAGSNRVIVNSSGINVTGTVTADGLTVDSGTASPIVNLSRSGTHSGITFSQTISNVAGAGADLITYSANNDTGFNWQTTDSGGTQAKALLIAPNRDISFYEDTGTTAKLFWDASAESLGIGTSSIDNNAKLHIEDSAYPIINLDRSSLSADGNHLGYINFQSNGDIYGYIGGWVEDLSETDGELRFATQKGTSLTDKMVITSDGNVGIGTSSPAVELDVRNDGANGIAEIGVRGGTNGAGVVQISGHGTTYGSTSFDLIQNASAAYAYQRANLPLIFGTNNTERMRIDASGRVGIGVTPSSGIQLEVGNSTNSSAVSRVTNGTVSVDLTASSSGKAFLEVGTNHPLVFATNATERARIDTSGNLLVGKTSSGISNSGFEVGQSGQINVTQAGAVVGRFNRKTSDGSILELQKDGTTVGIIGSATSGKMSVIGTNQNLQIGANGANVFNVSTTSVYPATDNATDLGFNTSLRWKDFYLSGTAYLGKAIDEATLPSTPANHAITLYPPITTARYGGGISWSEGTNTAASINAVDAGSGGALHLAFSTGSNSAIAERMRLDTSGNLLVGKTAANFTVAGHEIKPGGFAGFTRDGGSPIIANRLTSDGDIIEFYRGSTSVGSIGTLNTNRIFFGGVDTGFMIASDLDCIYPTNGGDTARDNAVDLGNSGTRFKDLHLSGTGFVERISTDHDGDWGLEMTGVTSARIRFNSSAGGSTQVGSITVSTTATAYNTSSDYRLKENVVAMSGATERLKQLAPKRFNFIADADTTVDGFLAHEVQSVVPEAITGTHNEVDDDGNPVYQGIDQSKLVPLLVATIQELEARIAALESN